MPSRKNRIRQKAENENIRLISERESVEAQIKTESLPPEKQVNEEKEVEMEIGQRGTAQHNGLDRFAPFPRKMSSESLKEDGKDVNQRKEEPKKTERKQSSEKENTKPQRSQNKGKIAKKAEPQENKKGTTEYIYTDLMERHNEIGRVLRAIQDKIPNDKTSDKKTIKQEIKNISSMLQIYEENVLSAALKIFDTDSSNSSDELKSALKACVSRSKKQSDEKKDELSSAMKKLHIISKKAPVKQKKESKKELKKVFNGGVNNSNNSIPPRSQNEKDPEKKPAAKNSDPIRERSGLSRTSESSINDAQMDVRALDPYRHYDEIDELAAQIGSVCEIVPERQYAPHMIIREEVTAMEQEISDFTRVDDFCEDCDFRGMPCEQHDELAEWGK